MFDLEQAITDWRRKMLAAGIKTPAPLEELEIHMREEIERQTRSGLDEQEAFNSAVQKIGQARLLKTEFKKADGLIESQLVKLAGIACGLVAGLFLLLILHKLLAVHAVNLTERILGLIAVAFAVLSWRYGRTFLPVVRNQRFRTAIGAACCLASAGGMMLTIKFIPQFFARPEGAEIPVGQLLVALAWAWTVAAILGTIAYWLEAVARKTDEQNV